MPVGEKIINEAKLQLLAPSYVDSEVQQNSGFGILNWLNGRWPRRTSLAQKVTQSGKHSNFEKVALPAFDRPFSFCRAVRERAERKSLSLSGTGQTSRAWEAGGWTCRIGFLVVFLPAEELTWNSTLTETVAITAQG
jgi:hypothetical protein